jgi:hypothetical protein
MINKPKPIMIQAVSETELEEKRAALQTLANVATIESLKILEDAINRNIDVNQKLLRAKKLGAI